jgi:hypothetical protein
MPAAGALRAGRFGAILTDSGREVTVARATLAPAPAGGQQPLA